MNQDFVTQLRLELREAALREERRTPMGRRLVRARRGVPGPGPLAVALAVALLALAVALGALALRGEPEPVKPRVIDSFKVAESTQSVSSGFGAAWAADPVRGEVLRISPKTRRVTARIPLGGEVLARAGAGAVWALTGDLLTSGSQGPVRLARIDPRTNRVIARIPVRSPQGANFSPLELQVDRDRVWIVGAEGALRIDPARNAPDRFVSYAPGGGTVAEGERVWVLRTDGRLREFDARTGHRVDDVQLNAPQGAHLGEGPPGRLTLAASTTLTLIDHASGRPLWRAALHGVVRGSVFDGDSVWAYVSHVPDAPDQLVRLDADSGRRTGQVLLRAAEGVGLARVGGSIWVLDTGGTITVVR